MKSLVTHSETETIAAGVNFARELQRGDIVACYGDLGTGKTRFIQGICKGRGVTEHVASPTFTIVNEYTTADCPLYHFDFYRMQSVGELREIGFDEYINGDGICLIEWADKVIDRLPPNRFDVKFKLGKDEQTRGITIDHVVEVAA